MNTKISIVIPVYNVEDYLCKCLDSVIDQTHTNWECLLIDDGSTDTSGKICDDYALKDNRFKVFHKDNGGVSSARNLGLDNVKSDWVAFIDSDDWVESDWLETVVNAVEEKKYDIYTWGILFNKNGEEYRERYILEKRDYKCSTDFIQSVNYKHGSCCYLFNTEWILKYNCRFPEGIKRAEDQCFNLQYLSHNPRIGTIPRAFYHYVFRSDSTVNMELTPALVKDILDVAIFFVKYSANYRDIYENFIKISCRQLFVDYIRYIDRIKPTSYTAANRIFREKYMAFLPYSSCLITSPLLFVAFFSTKKAASIMRQKSAKRRKQMSCPKDQSTENVSIAFLTQMFPYGGAERNIIDIGTYLKDRGFCVYVFCSQHKVDAYPDDIRFDIPVFEMGMDFDIRKEETVWKMKEILDNRHIKLDVMTGLAVGIPVRSIKETLGCKFIYTNQEMPFCRTKYELFWAKERKGLINQLKSRVLLPATNNRFIHHFDNIYTKRHRKVYDESDIYTCLCDGYKKQLDYAFGLKEAESKIRVIHNFEFVADHLPATKREKTVLFVGRLYLPSKRVDRLLRIWKLVQDRLPDWKLVIAGDGMHREYLEKLSVSLGLNRCTFLGWANNVTDLMRKSSILCFTSECEGWPLVLTEAQVNGLPAMAFDCCAGVHEILSPDGENGILIPRHDEKAYANALVALAHDEEQRKRIASNAFQAVKRYTLEETGTQWIRMIESLVESKE